MSAAQKTVGDDADTAPPPPRPVTGSGIELPLVATVSDHANRDDERPGEYPFTRGIFPDG